MFDVWKNVLAEIEQKISHEAYVTWLTGVSLISSENGKIIIGVPSVLKIVPIRKKYDPLIREALNNNNIEVKDIEYVASTNTTIKKTPREITASVASSVTQPKQTTSHRSQNNFITGLNSSYSLDNFVVGSNNDLAVSVAKNVIEKPGDRYNPFFLYGGPGLGKTHLVEAIGNELLKKNPNLKVRYMPVNTFYAEFVESIKNGTGHTFSQKIKKLDVLIIDDFQMIIGKNASQEEFFNIFNELHQAHKQIIVTSDRLPDQIKTVDPRLASRLTWAGAIDLQMPNFEDKCAIIKMKAEFIGVDIEDEAVEYLAKNIKTNIRDLEGAFNKLVALAELKNISPLEIINDGYINASPTTRKATVSARQIVDKVAKFYNISYNELCGRSRVTHIKTARQVAMYLLSEELSMSTTKIALEVGLKDHTTVMHGIKKIKGDLKLNFSLREQTASIREKIYE